LYNINTKMKVKSKTTKLILFLLIVLIAVPTVLFSIPKKVSAQAADVAAKAKVPVSTTQSPGSGPQAGGWLQRASDWLTSKSDVSIMTDSKQSLAMKIAAAGREVLRQALIVLGHKLLDTMTQSTVNWINSGFHGSPLFVQNPSKFFGDIGKYEIKSIINMIGYDSMQPFGQQYALNLIARYKAASQSDMQSSLNVILNDSSLATQYRNNFFAGGWNAFLVNTQYPQNNIIGYNIKMDETVLSKLAGNKSTTNTIQKAQSLLSQGNGFLSPTMCPTSVNPNYNNGTNEFNPPTYNNATADEKFYSDVPACIHNTVSSQDMQGKVTYSEGTVCINQTDIDKANAHADYLKGEDQARFAATSQCVDKNGKSALVATTPGAVAANHIMTALNLKTNVAGLDAALGNSMSAILNAFMNHFLQEGLSGLSNAISGTSSSSSDSWSYNGQTLDSTTTSSTATLTVPTNVSVNIGNSTSTTISGGTTPYSIGTAPDSTIATAQIGTDGTTLSVTGVTQGTTTMVVQDSSSTSTTATPTAQISTITLGGSTGTAGMLSATINSITTSILVTTSDTTTTAATNLMNAINANTKINTSVVVTNTTPGVITITSQTSGTTGVFSLTSANTTTALTATSALATSASDGVSPNQTVTVTITVGTNGTIALNFTNTAKNPTSITTSVGSAVTNLTLSGGIAPYSVQTAPDSTLALALISNNNLSLIGVAAGTTSIILSDSATPATTITLPIIVGNESTLVSSPVSVSATSDATSGISTTDITISGGTPPYTIVTQPSSIASASISGNTLSVIGTAAGTTSVTIQDSYSPAETMTIPITITASTTTGGAQ
jgi:hypothetical protein